MTLKEVQALVSGLKQFQREIAKKDSPFHEPNPRQVALIGNLVGYIEVLVDDVHASGGV